MFKGDKYFKLMETIKFPEIMLAYRNRSFSLIYLIGLANKGFILLLTFNSAFVFFGLGVLLDTLLGRRLYNDALIAFKIRYLFQLDRNNIAHWVYR
jgi:hypothetical protein